MPTQEEGEYRPDAYRSPSVHVGIAPRAQPYDESMDSLSVAITTAAAAGLKICFEKVRRGCPGFQNAGPLINHFMQGSATHLFLAGDDVLYPPDTIIRLVNDDKDIVSGIYRKNILSRIEPANSVESEDKFLEYWEQGGIYETEYAACHTMTIKRHVIEKMIADYPELQYDTDVNGEVHCGLFLPIIKDRKCFQDDWAFSIRARQSGFRIWNDFGCRLKHYCGDFMGIEIEAAKV